MSENQKKVLEYAASLVPTANDAADLLFSCAMMVIINIGATKERVIHNVDAYFKGDANVN